MMTAWQDRRRFAKTLEDILPLFQRKERRNTLEPLANATVALIEGLMALDIGTHVARRLRVRQRQMEWR